MKDGFTLSIETMHCADRGTQENVCRLSSSSEPPHIYYTTVILYSFDHNVIQVFVFLGTSITT